LSYRGLQVASCGMLVVEVVSRLVWVVALCLDSWGWGWGLDLDLMFFAEPKRFFVCGGFLGDLWFDKSIPINAFSFVCDLMVLGI